MIATRIVYTYRPMYYTYHRLSFGYNYHEVGDTIVKINPEYLGNSNTNLKYFFAIYQFIYDKRDIKAYPLKGFWMDLLLKEEGFGIRSIENYSNLYFQPLISYFGQISDKWYYSVGVKGRYSVNKKLPYTKKAALGYGDFMHGFEYYVIDGTDFLISKNYIKFQLLAPRTITLDYVPFKQFKKIHYAFYLNYFFDMGYVHDDYTDPTNFMVNKFLYSTGIGLDYVTYYDQTIRLEYSINRFGDHGFFIHVFAPILKSN